MEKNMENDKEQFYEDYSVAIYIYIRDMNNKIENQAKKN